MIELRYRLYGLIHQLAKVILRKSKLSTGKIYPTHIEIGCPYESCTALWWSFVETSKIDSFEFTGTHFAGYIAESKEWCHASWIWTNAAIVRLYCENGSIEKAVALSDKLVYYQRECGGWIVRNDYDTKGAIPMLAPNDSAYIANNAFVTLYEVTNDKRYLIIARRCADWIIDTARPDGLVYTGYNLRDEKWDIDDVIVDIGFTAGLFSKLAELTGEQRYVDFLKKFVNKYIELFYVPEKKGFCTSIGKSNQHQGGIFTRGLAWALEGLIPAYKVLKDERIKIVIQETIDNLLKQQLGNGGWPYNLAHKLMGEDCKGVSVIAKDMMDWYALTKDERIRESATKALQWCCEHTATESVAKGGIFSYSVEGGIVKDLYTSCAFVYASVYALELKKMIVNYESC